MPDEEILNTEEPTTDEPNTENPVTEEPVSEDPTPTPTRTMLDDVKLALRLTTTAYDNELTDLINAGLLDLGVAGVTIADDSDSDSSEEPSGVTTDDALVKRAVITYCKIHFGSPADFDRLKRAYDEQKAQLVTCTGYTDWGDS